MNKTSKTVSSIYGILLIIGGIMGFVKAHSKMSLITGLVSGIFIFTACKLGEKKPYEAYLFISAISLALAGFFAGRFSYSHAFMPAGLMLILSVTTLVVVGMNIVKGK